MTDRQPKEYAFPHHQQSEGYIQNHPGLTKREYFAAMAMQAIITNLDELNPDVVSQQAVAEADALIAALSQ